MHRLAVSFCMGLAAASLGAQERLNVRTGTWEVTATTEISGMPLSKEMLAKLKPEQRAEVEAAMRAEAAKGPQTETTTECITEDDLERPFKASQTENCTQTIVQTTRTAQEVRLECKGEQPSRGFLRINAPSSESMTAQLELTSGDGPDAFVLKSRMKGRWLEEACEDEDAYDEEDDYEDDSDPSEFDEPEDEG